MKSFSSCWPLNECGVFFFWGVYFCYLPYFRLQLYIYCKIKRPSKVYKQMLEMESRFFYLLQCLKWEESSWTYTQDVLRGLWSRCIFSENDAYDFVTNWLLHLSVYTLSLLENAVTSSHIPEENASYRACVTWVFSHALTK